MDFFEIGSCKLFAWGWLQNIFLIFSSWVARITGRAPGSSLENACSIMLGKIIIKSKQHAKECLAQEKGNWDAVPKGPWPIYPKSTKEQWWLLEYQLSQGVGPFHQDYSWGDVALNASFSGRTLQRRPLLGRTQHQGSAVSIPGYGKSKCLVAFQRLPHLTDILTLLKWSCRKITYVVIYPLTKKEFTDVIIEFEEHLTYQLKPKSSTMFC
jgi:hypothetical protein